VLLVALAAFAALVAWIALRNRQPPVLPADAVHARFDGADACLTCHGPAGPNPQPASHPVGRDCTRCHGFPN
jgi:hypothetical protein